MSQRPSTCSKARRLGELCSSTPTSSCTRSTRRVGFTRGEIMAGRRSQRLPESGHPMAVVLGVPPDRDQPPRSRTPTRRGIGLGARRRLGGCTHNVGAAAVFGPSSDPGTAPSRTRSASQPGSRCGTGGTVHRAWGWRSYRTTPTSPASARSDGSIPWPRGTSAARRPVRKPRPVCHQEASRRSVDEHGKDVGSVVVPGEVVDGLLMKASI